MKPRIPKKYRQPLTLVPKEKPCSACNGSGRYDHNGAPPCGACNGTGKVPTNEAEANRTR